MSREAPVIGKAFRLTSFSLALASLVILGTIAYSIYEEFNYLFTGPQDLFQFRQEENENDIDLILDLMIPNKGMYPLELSINVTATIGGQRLADGSSGTIVIPPGLEERVLLVMKIEREDMVIAQPREGERIGMNVTVRAGFQPFAFITVSAGQEFEERVRMLGSREPLAATDMLMAMREE